MDIQRRLIIELIKGIAFALTVVGFIANLLEYQLPINNTIVLIIIIVLAIIYALITIWSEKNQGRIHRFKPNSREEADFFLKWYSEPGLLRIFCTDLLWLKDYPDILSVLSKKEDNLHLYLLKYKDEEVIKLFHSGAYVYKVKQKVKSSHRFSTRSDEGIQAVIIRNKETENPQKIEIQEYHNEPAFYNLITDMLDDCYERKFHNSKDKTIE